MKLSVVIPLYNEGGSVRPLGEALLEALGPLEYQFEVILVDDGSTDDTFARARGLTGQDGRFQVVKLRKNFGQTAALRAGFDHAQGDVIATMDGDLQNDPRDIAPLVRTLGEGYDVVTGWREDRKDDFWVRTLPSRAANWLVRKVTGASIIDNGCALRVYRAEAIQGIPLYSEMHRLLPTILYLSGRSITQVKVRHHPRRHGESKYGLMRTYKVLIDLAVLMLILKASRYPLFGFGYAALVPAVLFFVSVTGAASQVLLYPDTSAVVYFGASFLWATLSVALLVFGCLCSMVYTEGEYARPGPVRPEVLRGRDK
jgi:glycosyltransferase involved in cell wall biosynthesis